MTSDYPPLMDDRERLAGYVEVWWQAVDDFTHLLEGLDDEHWRAATDLPGWDVHAVAAHIAHLESILAGGADETVDVGEPDHVRGLMGLYTEQGVVARRDRSPDDLITEIRSATTARHTALLADPPTDPDGPPSPTFPGVPWGWGTLLRNRPLDVWMHEQDIRRAVGRPGGMDSPAAQHVADYLVESLPVVVGKRVAPPAGTTVTLAVTGSAPLTVATGDDGRARAVERPERPSVSIAMPRESFVVLAGGRREPDPDTVEITGDADLGRRVLDMLAVTP